MIKVMVMVKGNRDTESGKLPTEKELADMMRFNEELVEKGVMLAGEGLHPSSKGKRVRFSTDGRKTVVDGPFAETKELVAGFWLWKVDSIEHAVELARRIPFGLPPEDCDVEIRQVHAAEDFGEALTPELRAKEEALRARVETTTK